MNVNLLSAAIGYVGVLLGLAFGQAKLMLPKHALDIVVGASEPLTEGAGANGHIIWFGGNLIPDRAAHAAAKLGNVFLCHPLKLSSHGKFVCADLASVTEPAALPQFKRLRRYGPSVKNGRL